MRSRSAMIVAERRAARLAAMTADERVRLAVRLGEEGLADFMSVHRLDRRTVVARIKAAHRLGRRPSLSGDVD